MLAMTLATDQILDALKLAAQCDDNESAPLDQRIVALHITSSEDMDALLAALDAHLAEVTACDSASRGDSALAELFSRFWQFLQSTRNARGLEPETIERILRLYRRLAPQSRARPHLLRALAAAGDSDSLTAFVELLISDPPQAEHDDPALAFVPLFQQTEYSVDALFPRLLDILEQPAYAAVVLDLANFLTRRDRVDEHPAAGRVDQLAALLGGVVQRLERIAEQPKKFASSPQELTRLVAEGVALVVPLCDALALIGDDRVTGKLHQAMGLAHRRVRTEAAAALARLGDDAGLEMLAAMAAEPPVRTRALAYLDELGQGDRAAEEHRTPLARAEGEVAAWLAEPTHFAAPPASLELIDSCRLYWPGYSAQIPCFLFRFEYRLGERSHTGIALSGPVTHVLNVDLQDLPPADIYAAYVGWHAEHEDIRETPAEHLSPAEQAAWPDVRERLEMQGYSVVALVKLAHFFEQLHWVTTAEHGGRGGVAIIHGDDFHWHPTAATRRPLGPTEVYYLHKGREILRTFNPQ